MIAQTQTAEPTGYQITWEKLPADYQLPDDPVENLGHPLVAFGLRELLVVAGKITPNTLVASNFGICAKVDGRIVVKAPDWVYIPSVPRDVSAPPDETTAEEQTKDRRSYTPVAEGDKPLVVMEFLSDSENDEYSVKPTPPYGKWWFYEQILQVPIYVIFDPKSGWLEVYRLQSGRYSPQPADSNGRFWIPGIDLFLGVWYGSKEGDRTGYWLRWWDDWGNMLLWLLEKSAQEQQELVQKEEQLAQKDEQLVQKDEQLAQKDEQLAQLRDRLRSAGVSEEELRKLTGE